MKHILAASGVLLLMCAASTTPSHADPGRGVATQCYLWANNASPPLNVPYEPSPTYSFNSQNRAGGISVTRTGTGIYSVKCTGVGGGSPWGSGGHVQVSAYGFSNNGSCHVVSWGTGGPDFTATVNCFGGGGTGGVLKDSQFDLLFVW